MTPTRKIMPFGVPLPSPSINELALSPVEASDPVRVLAWEALKGCRLAAEKSRAASIAIQADATLSEGGQHVKANEISFAVTNRALPGIDRARQTIVTVVNSLREKTKSPTEDIGVKANMQASELRNLLSSMTPKARMDAIAKSLAEGDDSLAGAALSGSRFLTGLSQVEQQHVRDLWAHARMPAEMARIKQLEADLTHLERAGSLLIGYQLKCADQNIVAAARASQAAAAAAIKAAGI